MNCRHFKIRANGFSWLTVSIISLKTIGRAIPNSPMLGAFVKVSGMFELDYFLDRMKKVLSKFPQKIIDSNMDAITTAYNEVK